MNRYIEKLNAFLAEQSPKFGYDDANSILEMLYYYYTENNPVDNGVIRCQFKELDSVLSKLSWSECEQVFSIAISLCCSHSQQAFTDGVHIGMRLFTELQISDDEQAKQRE